jgi:antibiotic biosynthesis monooxygenase (ABM) superfamily enzyme
MNVERQMTNRYARIVSLWIHPGQEAAFEAFEREAARIMARHGGQIDYAVRMSPLEGAGPNDATPHEIHAVSFPDKAAADAYAGDPDTLAQREKRARIISRTVLMAGREAGPY